MTAVNSETISNVIQDANAERLKAQEDYDAIVFDANRNSDQDRADLASAMKVLGITHDKVIADQQAVMESRKLAAAAAGHPQAEKETKAARDALNEFLNHTKRAMLEQITRLEDQHRQALSEASAKQTRILASLLKLRRHRLQHGPLRVKNLLADEPEGSPAEIRINGEFHDPAKGVNPRTGF